MHRAVCVFTFVIRNAIMLSSFAHVGFPDHHAVHRRDAEPAVSRTPLASTARHRRRVPAEPSRDCDPDGACQRTATPAGRPCRSSLSCGPGPRPAGCRAARGGARASVGPGAADGVASRGTQPGAMPISRRWGGPRARRLADPCQASRDAAGCTVIAMGYGQARDDEKRRRLNDVEQALEPDPSIDAVRNGGDRITVA